MALLTREAASDLIYRSGLLLDEGDWDGFLALCAPGFRYEIGSYSPEIRRDMCWLDQDRAGMQQLFATLPRHHSDRAPLSRHLTVYTVDLLDDGHQASAVSALQVFRTELDGGRSELFATGKIFDRLDLVAEQPRLAHRRIRLDTRLLGIGSHIPF
jgi:methanesulfonate monooxygenase small subunit